MRGLYPGASGDILCVVLSPPDRPPPADPFDLGIDPEHTYEEESWRPSTDYPVITTHRFRRAGDRLEVLTTPAYGYGAPHTRGGRIAAVWRNVLRAEVIFDGTDRPIHFDLLGRKLIDLPGEFRVPVPITHDPLDPALWVALLTTLAEEGPRLYPELGAQAFTRDELEGATRLRWPTGYGFQRDVTGEVTRVDCWMATSSPPLLDVALVRPRDPERPTIAVITGYFKPGLAAVDAAVGRLKALLVS